MNSILLISVIVTGIAFLIWLYLIFLRGRFWCTDIQLRLPDFQHADMKDWPLVCVIIPARNEAETIPDTIPNLLHQEYPGTFHVFLVDDGSSDGTGELAESISRKRNASGHFSVVSGKPLQKDWTGKLWALRQGIQASRHLKPKFYLFTDADIRHPPVILKALVCKAEKEQLDLVSLMVKLNVSTFWEKVLIPAFVFFFSKLYPFRWVNTRNRHEAAAAGGCILIREQALSKTGGLKRLSSALIDDIALARQIKKADGSIWLGLTQNLLSLRSYNGLRGVWHMVSRTAYTQLRYSPILFMCTVLGMTSIYLVPPISSIIGIAYLMLNGVGAAGFGCAVLGSMTWLIMSLSFKPMLRWHGISVWYAPLLSTAGLLYTLMTIDSAIRHYRGRGGAWKGRTYNRF